MHTGDSSDGRACDEHFSSMRFSNGLTIQSEIVNGFDDNNLEQRRLDPRSLRADIVLFGIGARLDMMLDQLPEHEVPSVMSRATLEWLGWLQTHLKTRNGRPALIVWLEYFAGHFPTPSGEFDESRERAFGDACRPIVNLSLARNGARRVHGNLAALKVGVPILRTFDHSASLFEDHRGRRHRAAFGDSFSMFEGDNEKNPLDCRHWCMPGPTTEARTHSLIAIAQAHNMTSK